MPAEATTPLLNSYKLRYLLRIIPQTFFGGIYLSFGLRPPWYIYIGQLLIWLLPALTGIIFTAIIKNTKISQNIGALICGCLVAILHLFLHFCVLFTRSKLTSKNTGTHNFLAEDNEVTFVSFFSLETFEFIFPRKKFLINYITHSLCAGMLVGVSFLLLLPTNVDLFIQHNAACYVFMMFGWITVCIAHYPLLGQSPKESTVFYMSDDFELNQIMRSVYCIIMGITLYVLRVYSNYKNISFGLAITFDILPLLWLLGILPSLDACLAWLLEQSLLLLLGGSPMASLPRILAISIISWSTVGIVYGSQLSISVHALGSAVGLLLSVDIVTELWKVYLKLCHLRNQTSVVKLNSSARNSVSMKYLILIFVLTVISVTITVLVEIHVSREKTRVVYDVFGALLIASVVFVKLLSNLRAMYFLGLFKNPVYMAASKSESFARVLWFVRSIVLPLILQFVVALIMVDTDPSACCSFIYVLLVCRSYRMVWQHTSRCSYDVTIYMIVYWCDDVGEWNELDANLQLFVISIGLYWAMAFLEKLSWVILLVLNSFKQSKHQLFKVKISLAFSFLLLPIALAVLVTTSVLSVPLLTLFTLPIFLIGFPRPKCLWPNATLKYRTSSQDWIYYEHLTPAFIEKLKERMDLNDFETGSYYIGRYLDRLVWVSILEKGFLYSNLVVKGLELQETSCHATEVALLDDMIDYTHQGSNISWNKYFSTAVTPVAILELETYSDARNVLTGIIDSPDFSIKVSEIFLKSLTFCLLQYVKHKGGKTCQNNNYEDIMNDVDSGAIEYSTQTTSFSVVEGSKDDQFIIPEPVLTYDHIKSHSEIVSRKRADKLSELSETESDDEFGNLGFDDSDDSLGQDKPYVHETKYDNEGYTVSSVAVVLKPPLQWLAECPFNEEVLTQFSHYFPMDWYQYVISSLENENAEEIALDRNLTRMYRTLVLSSYYLTHIAVDSSSSKASQTHIYRNFKGTLSSSHHVSWLETHGDLKCIVAKAYRMAFKAVYDSYVIGVDLDKDLLDILKDFEQQWFIGDEEDELWTSHILQGTPNLLSIGFDKKKNIYTSRLLSKQPLDITLFKLNGECVRSLWAALSLELFYMTNDDDERYSIQALPGVLRNIITQSADPPLGYPVFSSGFVNMTFF